MRYRFFVNGIIALMLLTVSAAPAAADDGFLGGVLGAGLGGWLGSTVGHGSGRLVATGLGVATGAMIGSSIGQAATSYSGPSSGGYAYFGSSNYVAPPVYTPTYVAPPSAPPSVVYVQQPVYVTGGYVDGYPPPECREYRQTILIDGREELSRGTVCRQPDGTWKLQ